MSLSLIKNTLKVIFGDFEQEELKKFLLLGVIAALIMGIYQTLQPLKTILFQDIVGLDYLPKAKVLAFLLFFPLMIKYSVLVSRVSRQMLFYIVSSAFAITLILISSFMLHPQMGLANVTADSSRFLGWAWYVCVENFGLFIIPLFWAFAIDVTAPESAKRGFSLIVMLGLIGAALFPPLLTRIPYTYQIHLAYLVTITGLLIFLIPLLVSFFMRTISAKQMVGFPEKGPEGINIEEDHAGVVDQQRPADAQHYTYTDSTKPQSYGGLRQLFNPYLLGMLGILVCYGMIERFLHVRFLRIIDSGLPTAVLKAQYLGDYATYTHGAMFLLLFINWRIGLTTSLLLMPLIFGCLLFLTTFSTTLIPLFWFMVAAQAISGAINVPSMKQLYIPTSPDAQYKSQLWIVRLGPLIGSTASMYLPLSVAGSPLFIGVIAIWVLIVFYLGRTYHKAVKGDREIC